MIILWYIALVAPILASIGLIFLKLSFPYMKPEFRRGMVFLLGAAFLAVISGLISIVLVIMGIETTHLIWSSVPIIYFVSNILFILNTTKIERMFRVMVYDVDSGTRSTKMYSK